MMLFDAIEPFEEYLKETEKPTAIEDRGLIPEAPLSAKKAYKEYIENLKEAKRQNVSI